MKMIIAVLLIVATLCFFGCASTGKDAEAGNKEETNDLYVMVNGEKHEVGYFSSLNQILQNELQYCKITVVSKLLKVHGRAYFGSIGYILDVNSYVELQGIYSDTYYFDTTGYEDTVKNWQPGDIIEATGHPFIAGHLYVMQGWNAIKGDGTITVKNITRNETITIKCQST